MCLTRAADLQISHVQQSRPPVISSMIQNSPRSGTISVMRPRCTRAPLYRAVIQSPAASSLQVATVSSAKVMSRILSEAFHSHRVHVQGCMRVSTA